MPPGLFGSYCRETVLSPQRSAYFCICSQVLMLCHLYRLFISPEQNEVAADIAQEGVLPAYGHNGALASAPRIFLHVVFDGHDEPAQVNICFSYKKKGFREDGLRVRGQLSELSGGASGPLGQPGPPKGPV